MTLEASRRDRGSPHSALADTFLTTALLGCTALLLAAAPPGRAAPEDPGRKGTMRDEHQHRGHQHHGHGTAEGLRHDFSDVERWLRTFEGDDRDAWQKPDEVVSLLELAPGMTVADLGAGTGYFLARLSRAVEPGGKVLALDPEPSLARFMEERAEREGLAAVEIREIPFDDPRLGPASVDRVLIVNTWHHIGDRGAYAARLRTALKPGGRIWVVDFTAESPHGPPAEHRLSAERVAEELRQGGLEAEVAAETLPYQYAVSARAPTS